MPVLLICRAPPATPPLKRRLYAEPFRRKTLSNSRFIFDMVKAFGNISQSAVNIENSDFSIHRLIDFTKQILNYHSTKFRSRIQMATVIIRSEQNFQNTVI
jgi:hypothetical protein